MGESGCEPETGGVAAQSRRAARLGGARTGTKAGDAEAAQVVARRGRWESMPPRRRYWCVGLAFGVLLSGCAASSTSRPTVRVTLSDFAVDPEVATVAPGRYDLLLTNEGPTVHELVVARTGHRADGLPLSPDGIDADEPSLETVGADEVVDLEDSDRLPVDLAPGHYVLYCNIEGHYRSGMYADLDVRPRGDRS